MARTFNVLTPHANVIAKYKELGFLPDDITVSSQEQTVFASMGNAKKLVLKDPSTKDREVTFVTSVTETGTRPITREVSKFYRTADGNVYFSEFLEGRSYGGKKVNHGRVVGKYKMPEFEIERNLETGSETITGIGGFTDVYEIPFTTGKFTDPSTGEETTLADLPRAKKCYFYVINGKKIELVGITFEEFMSKSVEELTEYGLKGKWPTTAPTEEAPKVTRSKKQE